MKLSCGIMVYLCNYVLGIGTNWLFNISNIIFLLILKCFNLSEEGDLYC